MPRTRDKYSYVFTPEYEMFEWNMGHVANYAELASLMTPRPFMVERVIATASPRMNGSPGNMPKCEGITTAWDWETAPRSNS